jgi:hypothetical protein
VNQTTMILAERTAPDGIRWQARVSADRARLEVVAIVPASVEPTVVTLLSDRDLRELLAEGAEQNEHTWVCIECGTANSRDRRWCALCSGHAIR